MIPPLPLGGSLDKIVPQSKLHDAIVIDDSKEACVLLPPPHPSTPPLNAVCTKILDKGMIPPLSWFCIGRRVPITVSVGMHANTSRVGSVGAILNPSIAPPHIITTAALPTHCVTQCCAGNLWRIPSVSFPLDCGDHNPPTRCQ